MFFDSLHKVRRFKVKDGAIACMAVAFLVLGSEVVSAQTAQSQDTRRQRSGTPVTADTAPGATIDKNRSDVESMEESYQPKGVEMGNFLLLPKLEVTEQFNSNIYAREHERKSDFLTIPEATLALRSRFDRHQLNAKVTGTQYLLHKYTQENRTDFSAETDGRLDVGESGELTSLLQYNLGHEDRGSPDDAGGNEPTETDTYRVKMGGKQRMGSYTLGAETTFTKLNFADVPGANGTTINNSRRDRNEYAGRLRGAYEMFPGYAAVTEVGVNKRVYDSSEDANGYRRSSSGYDVLAGLGIDISSLMKGDILVGYMMQDYEDERLKDPSGLSVRISLNWTPTPLTLVVPSFERSVIENTSSGVSGLVHTSTSVLVRHEYAPNILMVGSLGASYDDYSGSDQASWVYESMARVTYALSPEFNIGPELSYKDKQTDNTSGSFKQYKAMFKIGLQM